MAEQGNTVALTPVAVMPVEGEYMMRVADYDAAGKKSEIVAAMPNSANFREWSLMQQTVMLKKGPWRNSPVQEIVYAIAYANSLGLDIMQGDVFSTGEGRIGTSNKAKIKLALATGNVIGIETEIRDTGMPINLEKCPQKTDLECTATIHVKGWKKPIVLVQKLSAWYKKSNPNWQGNPEHMLRLNTTAHACEYVNPTATESDEAPPLTAPQPEPIMATGVTNG